MAIFGCGRSTDAGRDRRVADSDVELHQESIDASLGELLVDGGL